MMQQISDTEYVSQFAFPVNHEQNHGMQYNALKYEKQGIKTEEGLTLGLNEWLDIL